MYIINVGKFSKKFIFWLIFSVYKLTCTLSLIFGKVDENNNCLDLKNYKFNNIVVWSFYAI